MARLENFDEGAHGGRAFDPMRVRVVGYYRPFPWSRIGTDRTGRTSVERSIREHCRRNDLGLTGFFVETDSRAKRSLEDRTVGQEVMQQLRKGLADEVIVSRPEHIFTSAGSAVASLERWLDEGIGFRCADFFDGSPLHLGPEIQLLNAESLIHGLSALQRSVDYEQSRARVMNRKARGHWTGKTPFGFTLRDGVLVEDSDRIGRIQMMKSAHRHGRSYRQIAYQFGVSVGTAHRLVKTDLRRLKRMSPNASSDEDANP